MIKPSTDLSAARDGCRARLRGLRQHADKYPVAIADWCGELAIACGLTFPSFACCCASAPTLDGLRRGAAIGPHPVTRGAGRTRPGCGHLMAGLEPTPTSPQQ